MNVAKFSDDLGVAEKFQSNSEIAGSPRNSFRASLVQGPAGRALNRLRWRKPSDRIKLRIAVSLERESDGGR